jgi:pentatricopeptide repeat protein
MLHRFTTQKSGKVDKAMTLFRELKTMGFKPDVVTYTTLIAAGTKNALI